MPQCKTEREKLTKSEKEQFQDEYEKELKRIYPVSLPADSVILNVHSFFQSRYKGDIASYIEMHGADHERLMRLTNRTLGCTVQELESQKQTYHLTLRNTEKIDKSFPYGVPLVLNRELFDKLKTIRIVWRQVSESCASTVVQDIVIKEKAAAYEEGKIPVYDVAAESLCLQDIPYSMNGAYTPLADSFMENLTDYHMFYTNPFPDEEKRNKIIQFPLPMAKTVQAIQKIERGNPIQDIWNEMGLNFYQHPKSKHQYQSDEEIIKRLFGPHVDLRSYFNEIGKRYYRLVIMHREVSLYPDSFPLESMLRP